MSETLSTSAARAPSPEPTWEASIAPTALPRMPSIGPEAARASSGRALPRAWTEPSAIGSTSTFHTSVVPTIHSARLQAAVEVTPEGKLGGVVEPVVGEPDGVRDGVLLLLGRRRVGLLGDDLPGRVEGEVPVDGAVVRLHQRLDLAEQGAQVGHPAGAATEGAAETGAAEELLEGGALERVLAAVVRLVGGVAGVVAHAPTVRVGGKVGGVGLGSDP